MKDATETNYHVLFMQKWDNQINSECQQLSIELVYDILYDVQHTTQYSV